MLSCHGSCKYSHTIGSIRCNRNYPLPIIGNITKDSGKSLIGENIIDLLIQLQHIQKALSGSRFAGEKVMILTSLYRS